MGYKEDISIDKNNLFAECVRHPSVHLEYGRKHADALRARRLTELEEQEALNLADERVRAVTSEKKMTETAIRRIAENDEAYVAARRRSLDAAHEVNMLAAALDSLNAKTRMLGNLTHLQVSHWQAEPQVSGGFRERELEVVREELDAGLRDVKRPAKHKKPSPV